MLVGWLFGTVAVLLCLSVLFGLFVTLIAQTKSQQRRAMIAVMMLREEHPHLDPSPTVGPVPLAVALHGIEAVRMADPSLAQTIGKYPV